MNNRHSGILNALAVKAAQSSPLVHQKVNRRLVKIKEHHSQQQQQQQQQQQR